MESVVSAFPLVQDLNRMVVLLLIVNAVLTGLVVLFAWRAAFYRDRVDELEERSHAQNVQAAPPPVPASPPLSDDRPIPPARDVRRQLWGPGKSN